MFGVKYNQVNMRLTKDQVKHVAKLANLPLTSEEEEKYSEQLSKVLDHIDQLNKVDISKVEPRFNMTDKSNVMSEDETIPSLSQEEALSNASKKSGGFFETKGVFENE